MTTNLTMAFIVEVGKPREGALHSFVAGEASSMARVMLSSVLKSLDSMNDIRAMDYRDSPVVSRNL